MGKHDSRVSDDTVLVHDERHSMGAVVPPIFQTSIFAFESHQAMVDRFSGVSTQPVYSRVDNPTVSVLLDKMCQLERGEAAAAFSSGIAAISNAILGQVQVGDRIVCVQHVYPDTYRLLKGICARFGVTTDFVDGRNLAAIEEILPGARLLYLESPNTWVMQEQDLASIAKMAKASGVTTIVDNSWASPIFQKPLQVGITAIPLPGCWLAASRSLTSSYWKLRRISAPSSRHRKRHYCCADCAPCPSDYSGIRRAPC